MGENRKTKTPSHFAHTCPRQYSPTTTEQATSERSQKKRITMSHEAKICNYKIVRQRGSVLTHVLSTVLIRHRINGIRRVRSISGEIYALAIRRCILSAERAVKALLKELLQYFIVCSVPEPSLSFVPEAILRKSW